MSSAPSIINVHTPTASFAIVHSIEDESLQTLLDKLSRKKHTDYHGDRVQPGWVKYFWNDTVWNLDDDADYTIFSWRQKSSGDLNATPTLHVRNPAHPLPSPSTYRNPSFYVFNPALTPSVSGSPREAQQAKLSPRSIRSKKSHKTTAPIEDDGVPAHKKQFDKFHSENGVRTVLGSIGPVQGVRMLLKSGYRHVYISRKFALKHGFIPADAAPGWYGYSGLVNIGKWPLTVGRTKTVHSVFLSEEAHFDVVLGRSFMERRQLKTDPVDPTNIVCLDTGEKIDCELVILKDGKGEIVTVT